MVVEGELRLVGKTSHLLISLNPLFETLHLLHLLLCTLRIVPKVGSLSAQLLFFIFYFLLVYVEIMVERVGTLKQILQLVGCYHL